MANEEDDIFLNEKELEDELAGEDDVGSILLPEYPGFLPHGDTILLGEDHLGPHWPEASGEDGEDRAFFHDWGKANDDEVKAEAHRAKLCDRFYEILSYRQEIRRKNAFLQKKMAELYKKRKMDHLLKEDPKGLDLENKYLKRLLEVKTYTETVENQSKAINDNMESIAKSTEDLKSRVKKDQDEFFEKQKKVALGLTLKTEKKISAKAIATFLAIQADHNEELSRLRLKEIKIRRHLAQNQELLRELDSLGHGLRRADYEQLTYEYLNESRKCTEKIEEMEKVRGKARLVTQTLHQAQHRATMLDRELTELQQRAKELNEQVNEAKQRIYKLGKMRDNLKKSESELKKNAGLLALKPLLLDYERGLAEAAVVSDKLEQQRAMSKQRVVCVKGGQLNTPTNEFVEEPSHHVVDLWENNDNGL